MSWTCTSAVERRTQDEPTSKDPEDTYTHLIKSPLKDIVLAGYLYVITRNTNFIRRIILKINFALPMVRPVVSLSGEYEFESRK